jgi:hypothetical protein
MPAENRLRSRQLHLADYGGGLFLLNVAGRMDQLDKAVPLVPEIDRDQDEKRAIVELDLSRQVAAREVVFFRNPQAAHAPLENIRRTRSEPTVPLYAARVGALAAAKARLPAIPFATYLARPGGAHTPMHNSLLAAIAPPSDDLDSLVIAKKQLTILVDNGI